MKKKFLAMLMASVMVLGLAACGGSSDAATEGDAASGDLPTVGVLIYIHLYCKKFLAGSFGRQSKCRNAGR